MTELPEPLTPAEADLQGYGFMPFYGHRLFGSDFNAKCNDAEWRAGVTLWWAAWNQVPAGSLPDDDAALCRLADLGRDIKTWCKLRLNALHGFIKCSDGRLYHKVLADLVNDAWDRRIADRDRKRKSRGQDADVTRTSHGQGPENPVTKGVTARYDRDRDRDRKGIKNLEKKKDFNNSTSFFRLPRGPARDLSLSGASVARSAGAKPHEVTQPVSHHAVAGPVEAFPSTAVRRFGLNGARGPDTSDPAIRQALWEQKISTAICRDLPPADAAAVIDSYLRGEPEAKHIFDEYDQALKAGAQ